MIGIIGAMEEEVSRLMKLLEHEETEVHGSCTFYKGVLCGKEVVIVRSGIGKVNAAVCTQMLCDYYPIKAIINTGIAGSLDAEINIGDIVLSTDAVQHDMDTSVFGDPVGQIPRMSVFSFEADSAIRETARKANEVVNPEISTFEGRVLSGDQFISGKEKKRWLVDTFSGICCEMEGAAIAQACYLNQVPFLIIRAISDKADDSAHMDYGTFEAAAINHTCRLVCEMMKMLSES